MKTARTEKSKTTKSNPVETTGLVWENGWALEPVSDASDSGHLNLMLVNGTNVTVAPQIAHDGRTYKPTSLEPSVVRALTWAQRPLPYGTTRKLFQGVLDLVVKDFRFLESVARLLCYFIFSTWFSDRLTVAPSLAVVGSEVGEGIRLLRFLRGLCRRSLLLADASRTDLVSLPLSISPTLILDRPKLTSSLQRFLDTSNRRGLPVVRSGEILDVCCPKILYLGAAGLPPGVNGGMIRVTLPPAAEQARLEDQELSEALKLQGKLLAYRVANHAKVRVSRVTGHNFTPETAELAMNLAACIVDDAELAAGVVSLLEPQDEHIRQQPDHQFAAAVVEAVLACCHEKEKGRVQVKELAALTNTILDARGEMVAYSPEEVSHRLDALGLFRKRESPGSFLVFTTAMRGHVHDLAYAYRVSSVQKPMPGCPDCQKLGSAQGVM